MSSNSANTVSVILGLVFTVCVGTAIAFLSDGEASHSSIAGWNTSLVAAAATAITPAQKAYCERFTKGSDDVRRERCMPGCVYRVQEVEGQPITTLVTGPPDVILTSQSGKPILKFPPNSKLDDGRYIWVAMNGKTNGPFVCTPGENATTVPTIDEVAARNGSPAVIASLPSISGSTGISAPSVAAAQQRIDEAIASGKPASLADLMTTNPDKFVYQSTPDYLSADKPLGSGAGEGSGGGQQPSSEPIAPSTNTNPPINGGGNNFESPHLITSQCPDGTIACFKDTQTGQIFEIDGQTPVSYPEVACPGSGPVDTCYVNHGGIYDRYNNHRGEVQQTGIPSGPVVAEGSTVPKSGGPAIEDASMGDYKPAPGAFSVSPLPSSAPAGSSGGAGASAGTSEAPTGGSTGKPILDFVNNGKGGWVLEGTPAPAAPTGATETAAAPPPPAPAAPSATASAPPPGYDPNDVGQFLKRQQQLNDAADTASKPSTPPPAPEQAPPASQVPILSSLFRWTTPTGAFLGTIFYSSPAKAAECPGGFNTCSLDPPSK